MFDDEPNDPRSLGARSIDSIPRTATQPTAGRRSVVARPPSPTGAGRRRRRRSLPPPRSPSHRADGVRLGRARARARAAPGRRVPSRATRAFSRARRGDDVRDDDGGSRGAPRLGQSPRRRRRLRRRHLRRHHRLPPARGPRAPRRGLGVPRPPGATRHVQRRARGRGGRPRGPRRAHVARVPLPARERVQHARRRAGGARRRGHVRLPARRPRLPRVRPEARPHREGGGDAGRRGERRQGHPRRGSRIPPRRDGERHVRDRLRQPRRMEAETDVPAGASGQDDRP